MGGVFVQNPFYHMASRQAMRYSTSEFGLNGLQSQCLARRIPDMKMMRDEVAAREAERNNRDSKTIWRFATAEARIKLKRLYPRSYECYKILGERQGRGCPACLIVE